MTESAVDHAKNEKREKNLEEEQKWDMCDDKCTPIEIYYTISIMSISTM